LHSAKTSNCKAGCFGCPLVIFSKSPATLRGRSFARAGLMNWDR
jgi:hypothetical protein